VDLVKEFGASSEEARSAVSKDEVCGLFGSTKPARS
jgi:hypothetical protein